MVVQLDTMYDYLECLHKLSIVVDSKTLPENGQQTDICRKRWLDND